MLAFMRALVDEDCKAAFSSCCSMCAPLLLALVDKAVSLPCVCICCAHCCSVCVPIPLAFVILFVSLISLLAGNVPLLLRLIVLVIFAFFFWILYVLAPFFVVLVASDARFGGPFFACSFLKIFGQMVFSITVVCRGLSGASISARAASSSVSNVTSMGEPRIGLVDRSELDCDGSVTMYSPLALVGSAADGAASWLELAGASASMESRRVVP